MMRRVEDPRSVIISPLSMGEDPSIGNREEIEKHRKLLIALFAAYPNRNYFNAYERYRVGDTIVQLRQSLLRRNKLIDGLATPITKYDVLDAELAHGSFGVVYPVTGTLTLRRNNLSYEVDGNHVVKLTANFDTLYLPSFGLPPIQRSTQEDALEERRVMKDIGRFNPKPEVSHQVGEYEALTFITTRRFTGMPLSKIIKRQPLSIEQRLQLSIALLRALKEQVDDKGYIHRDIKPENIIVDLATMEVNIIDMGLSTPKAYPDLNPCGTSGYLAPEIFNFKGIDEKVDVFAMSRTLARLWGEDLSAWKRMNSREFIYQSRNFAFRPANLFKHPVSTQFDALSNNNRRSLTQILEISSKNTPEERANINDLITHFEELYIAVKYKTDDEAFKHALHIAFNYGNECRPALRAATSGAEFMNIFNHALEKIDDDKPMLDEFIHGLGWHSVVGVENKIELRDRVKNIVDQYRECAERHLLILEQAETIRNKFIVKNTSVSHDLDEFILEITHKLSHINDKPFDLDYLQKSIDRLNRDATKWSARLTELQNSERYQAIKSIVEHLAVPQDDPRPAYRAQVDAARLEPADPQPNRELSPLEVLKLNLIYAIRKYVRDTTTDKSFDMKTRAASKHRQNDIKELTAIINNANTPDDLLKETKARLGKMRYSLFGRSELRRNLEAVIEQYNAVMKPKK